MKKLGGCSSLTIVAGSTVKVPTEVLACLLCLDRIGAVWDSDRSSGITVSVGVFSARLPNVGLASAVGIVVAASLAVVSAPVVVVTVVVDSVVETVVVAVVVETVVVVVVVVLVVVVRRTAGTFPR